VGRRPTLDEKFWEEIAAAYCGALENHEPTTIPAQTFGERACTITAT
jgi:hypothetical protein